MSWRPFLRLDGLLFGQQEKVATFQSSASIKKGWNQNVSIWADFWRHDTQHNDTQHNDIQQSDNQNCTKKAAQVKRHSSYIDTLENDTKC
jgi:hypothetical protein